MQNEKNYHTVINGTRIYSEECECCKVINNDSVFKIHLKGGWVLNHFSGGEKYLGRFILQTELPRQDWFNLKGDELKYLGSNIKRITSSIKKCWKKIDDDDQVEQIYVVYLNDQPFKDKNKIDQQITYKYLHVHMHILTRTRKMRESLCCAKKNLGWHLVDCVSCFPEQYQIIDNDEKVTSLMTHLKESLSYHK